MPRRTGRAALRGGCGEGVLGPPPVTAPDPASNKERLLRWVGAARDKVLPHLGGNPVVSPDSRRWDDWTTRSLVHGLWKDPLPACSVLWLSEPDASQHEASPGSPNALAARPNPGLEGRTPSRFGVRTRGWP